MTFRSEAIPDEMTDFLKFVSHATSSTYRSMLIDVEEEMAHVTLVPLIRQS